MRLIITKKSIDHKQTLDYTDLNINQLIMVITSQKDEKIRRSNYK